MLADVPLGIAPVRTARPALRPDLVATSRVHVAPAHEQDRSTPRR
jgi:hypothetical protein